MYLSALVLAFPCFTSPKCDFWVNAIGFWRFGYVDLVFWTMKSSKVLLVMIFMTVDFPNLCYNGSLSEASSLYTCKSQIVPSYNLFMRLASDYI